MGFSDNILTKGARRLIEIKKQAKEASQKKKNSLAYRLVVTGWFPYVPPEVVRGKNVQKLENC
jgi:hypothetical protein